MKQHFRYDVEVIRVISMIFIVMGHCFAIYGVWETQLSIDEICTPSFFKGVNPFLIYYALPVFTTISGYLIGYRGIFESSDFTYKSFLLKKVERLYIPGLVFSLLYSALFHTDDFTDVASFVQIFIEGSGHLWFLYMLFVLYALSYPIYLVARKNENLSLFLSCTICLLSCFIPLGTSLLSVLFYQFFFFLGMKIGRKHQKKPIRTIKISIVWSIFLRGMIYVVSFYCLYLIKESPYVEIYSVFHMNFQYFQHWIFRLLIGIVAVSVSFTLLPVVVPPVHMIRTVSSLSYKLYIIHQFVLVSLLHYVPSLLSMVQNQNPLIFPFSLFAIVLLVSVIVSKIFSHIPVLKRI